jgi:hypothetical protein
MDLASFAAPFSLLLSFPIIVGCVACLELLGIDKLYSLGAKGHNI